MHRGYWVNKLDSASRACEIHKITKALRTLFPRQDREAHRPGQQTHRFGFYIASTLDFGRTGLGRGGKYDRGLGGLMTDIKHWSKVYGKEMEETGEQGNYQIIRRKALSPYPPVYRENSPLPLRQVS